MSPPLPSADMVPDLLKAVAWCIAYGLCGSNLRWFVRPSNERRPFTTVAFGFALAAWVLSLAAAAKCFFAGEWLVIVLAITGWFAPSGGRPQRQLDGIRRRIAAKPQSKAAAFDLNLSCGAALLLLVVVFAAAPVVVRPQVNYDVLSYHQPLAHRLAENGGVGAVEGNYYSRLPLAAFALYGPTLSDRTRTFDDPGPRVILLAAFAGALLSCAAVGRRLGAAGSTQFVAALLLGLNPAVWNGLQQGESDILTAFFALGALELVLWSITFRHGLAGLGAGFLAGSAIAVKFSALGIVAAPLGFLLVASAVTSSRFRRNGAWLRVLVGFACGVAASYGIWMLRAAICFGHPLHPFLGESAGWTAEQESFLIAQHHPLRLFSGEYWSAAVNRLAVFGTVVPGLQVSALMLAALSIWVVPGRWRSRAALVFLACGAGYAAWLTVGLAPERFALPLVAWMTVLGVMGVGAHRKVVRYALTALVGLSVLGMVMGNWTTYSVGWMKEAWRRPLPEDMLAPAWSAQGPTLLFFEARSRPFPPGSGASTVWDVPIWAEELKASVDGEDFGRRLAAKGWRSVFVNEVELGRLVDFYGGLRVEWRQGAASLRGPDREAEELLEAYPPARFAGLNDKDRRVLLEFLSLSRRAAVIRVPQGQRSEIWLSRLKVSSPNESGNDSSSHPSP